MIREYKKGHVIQESMTGGKYRKMKHEKGEEIYKKGMGGQQEIVEGNK